MIPGSATAGGQAIAAVYSLAKATLTGVQVWDGPPSAASLGPVALVVGYGGQGGPAVLAARDLPDLGGRVREEGDVVCILGAYSGSEGWEPLRTAVDNALDALADALQATPVMDGSWIGETVQWTQNAEPDGYSVQCAFSVHYVAEL